MKNQDKLGQSKTKRICLVMRAPLARYPSSIFQAELLAEAGHQVWILDTEDGGYQATALPESAERVILSKTDYSWRRKFPLLAPWRRRMFSSRLASALKDIKPHLVIVYEPPAMAALGRLVGKQSRPFNVVWHFHEYPETGPDIGPGTRRDIEYARAHAGDQDLVLFPDKFRANAFQEDVGLQRAPMIVMNCPRKVLELPTAGLRQKMPSCDDNPVIVLYNGSIGPSRGVDLAVRSMPYWPDNAVFALVGPCSESYRAQLIELATELSADQRLYFLGTVPPEEIWSVRRGADMALTMMIDEGERSLIYRYGAGASNKRFEAMAAGVVQITNEGPGIDEVVVDTHAGLAVDPNSPEALGQAVELLAQDPGQRKNMAEEARKSHLDRFNYEDQFALVLEALERMI